MLDLYLDDAKLLFLNAIYGVLYMAINLKPVFVATHFSVSGTVEPLFSA
jgi:hypothetical protein